MGSSLRQPGLGRQPKMILFIIDYDLREPRKIGQLPSAGCRLAMRNSVLERGCLGQEALPGEEGADFSRCP